MTLFTSSPGCPVELSLYFYLIYAGQNCFLTWFQSLVFVQFTGHAVRICSCPFPSNRMESDHCDNVVCFTSVSPVFSFQLSHPVVDHSRVKVALKTSNQDTDYINANFIKVKGHTYTALLMADCLFISFFTNWLGSKEQLNEINI